MKPFKSIFLFILFFSEANAQKIWSLKDCIDYALNNNISVQQSIIASKIAAATYQQSVGSLFPSINASSSLNYNYGRSLDPTSYQYVDQTFQSGGASLNGNLPIFQGLELQHNLRKSSIDFDVSKLDVRKVQNDIALSVAAAYLQILYSNEQLKATNDRIEAVTKERNRAKILVDNDLLAEGSLLDADALLATEEFNKASAENLLTSSKLTLIQLMQLEGANDIAIETPALEIPSQESLSLSSESVYNEALKNLPEVKASELRLKSAKESLGIARAARYPRLSAFGSLSTNYSNQATSLDGNPVFSGYVPSGAVTSSGEQVLQPVFNYKYIDTPVKDQLNNNFGKAIGFNLSIPLFNGWATNSSIKRSKLSFENARLNALQTKNTVFKNVQQAHADALAALNKYAAANKSVTAQEKAFLYTEKKYNAGLLNSIDYVNARNNYTKSQSDLIQSKFDLILKIKVLDYYLGKPLSF
ncbi:MAG TPA: TolC family protein [Bacteroidia bacterium]|nr:TolC family protein [Bacteroidia bacterium]HRB96900.1 TolC family protein [Nitrosomonas sp.]MBP7715223.1 TolC family protein [Bacteroidia bacterium]MBP8668584.1 TolC family protein [Bacteroidia bacterium]HOZ81428.1 TolC family protein [Bacteroidia bacterium]